VQGFSDQKTFLFPQGIAPSMRTLIFARGALMLSLIGAPLLVLLSGLNGEISNQIVTLDSNIAYGFADNESTGCVDHNLCGIPSPEFADRRTVVPPPDPLERPNKLMCELVQGGYYYEDDGEPHCIVH